jgi:hypothetical protein
MSYVHLIEACLGGAALVVIAAWIIAWRWL